MVYIFSSFMVISSSLQTLHRMQNRITSNTLYLTLFCKKIINSPFLCMDGGFAIIYYVHIYCFNILLRVLIWLPIALITVCKC